MCGEGSDVQRLFRRRFSCTEPMLRIKMTYSKRAPAAQQSAPGARPSRVSSVLRRPRYSPPHPPHLAHYTESHFITYLGSTVKIIPLTILTINEKLIQRYYIFYLLKSVSSLLIVACHHYLWYYLRRLH